MMGCYETCGFIPKVACFLCSICEKGPIVIVSSGQVGLRISFGKVIGKLTPGLHLINNCTETVKMVDIRSFIVDTDTQTLITSDGITIKVNSFAICKIISPEVAAFMCENPMSLVKTLLLAQIAAIVTTSTVEQFMNERESWEKDSLRILNE